MQHSLLLHWGGQTAAAAPVPPGAQQVNATYLATFYNGILPAPLGTVTQTQAARYQSAEQRAKADLIAGQTDLQDLNGNDTCFTVLVAVPDSH